MTRRSTPQSKIDENAFPVRVFLVVPGMGIGWNYDLLMSWMKTNWERSAWATHGGGRAAVEGGVVDRIALYVRHPEQVVDLLATFPQLRLADGTRSVCYSSPMR